MIRKLLVAAVLASTTFASGALASTVLVFGDRGERANLTTDLSGLGHTVTNQVALASDLSGFDTIWHVGAFTALSTSVQTALATFVNGGGGVHLTGERPCCEALNDSIETLVNSLVSGGGVGVGGIGDIGGPFTFNPSALGALGAFNASAPGGVSGITTANTLATGAGGQAVGGIWGESDMISGNGRVTLLMDVNWFIQGGNRVSQIDAIQTYLETSGGPAPVPLPASLPLLAFGLAAFGAIGRRRRKS